MIDEQTIRKLSQANLLAQKYLDYQRLYYAYKEEIDNGKTKTQATSNVSLNCGRSEITVHRAVRAMRIVKE